MNLSEVQGRVERKKLLEHHQTVERPRKGTPGWLETVLCTSTNFHSHIVFLKQHQIF